MGGMAMARTVGIGHQDFAQVITKNNFYIDKTDFIKEWWENDDVVTLITRPRRFGKTLNMSMLEYFFSVDHAGRNDLFEERRKIPEIAGRLSRNLLKLRQCKRIFFSQHKTKALPDHYKSI